jgi:hypothetical protein
MEYELNDFDLSILERAKNLGYPPAIAEWGRRQSDVVALKRAAFDFKDSMGLLNYGLHLISKGEEKEKGLSCLREAGDVYDNGAAFFELSRHAPSVSVARWADILSACERNHWGAQKVLKNSLQSIVDSIAYSDRSDISCEIALMIGRRVQAESGKLYGVLSGRMYFGNAMNLKIVYSECSAGARAAVQLWMCFAQYELNMPKDVARLIAKLAFDLKSWMKSK